MCVWRGWFAWIFFAAVVWEQLRWGECTVLGAGCRPLWQSSSLPQPRPVWRRWAGGRWLGQGMQPVVPAFEPWRWSIPHAGGLPPFLARCCCQPGWGLPALPRAPCRAGVCGRQRCQAGLGQAAALLGAQPGQERQEKGGEAAASRLPTENRVESCLLLGDSFRL